MFNVNILSKYIDMGLDVEMSQNQYTGTRIHISKGQHGVECILTSEFKNDDYENLIKLLDCMIEEWEGVDVI